MAAIEGEVALGLGFQIGRHAGGVAAVEAGLQQPRADAVTLGGALRTMGINPPGQ